MRTASHEPGTSTSTTSAPHRERIRTEGKFLVRDGERFFVKGVTYGTFRPHPVNRDYPDPQTVDNDFRRMREAGINTVRLYTVPPRWLLDCAESHTLSLIIGLPWAQHIAFLKDQATSRQITQDVRDGVNECAGHPAVLAYTVGNEIPAQIVRWYGAARIERFLANLYQTAKAVDPDTLVTYANYPTTEYLELPFMDFSFFNVYLESTDAFDAYIARLQTRAGDKPLVLAELGLDSRRHGETTQAMTLHQQIKAAFGRGCAGACVFAWTDEWHRGGADIKDWDFGLTGRQRDPKPALAAVQRGFKAVPFSLDEQLPKVSVVICTYNGAATIGECLEGLARLEYPEFEVIVVNDGSTDDTASIVSDYDVRLITTPNQGLSAARNTGMRASDGEIIAYIDDDTRPDPYWLLYLAHTFRTTSHAAVGGPNLSPDGDGFIAEAVDCSPGNPVHILMTDDVAEHIPGCNMAVRKSCLEAIGGFDPQFRVAGDDVDMCWRLQERGWTIGFSPAAVVWHHRRNSIRGFWRQQIGYGRAEALLERKWPDKYNGIGHPIWSGRVYGGSGPPRFRVRQRIYQGIWGSAAYQSADEKPPGRLESLLTMPEWYLTLGGFFLLLALAPLWTRMIVFVPVLTVAMTMTVALASRSAAAAQPAVLPAPGARRAGLRVVTTFLHLLQPVGRLWGRVSQGLTPWRHHNAWGYTWPRPMSYSTRSDVWHSTPERLGLLRDQLRQAGYVVRHGRPFDRWDLEVVGGLSCSIRIRILVEEHGWGKQFVQFRCWPRFSRTALVILVFFAMLSIIALWEQAWIAGSILGLLTTAIASQIIRQAAGASGAVRTAVRSSTIVLEAQPVETGTEVAIDASPMGEGGTDPAVQLQPFSISTVMLPNPSHQDSLASDIE